MELHCSESGPTICFIVLAFRNSVAELQTLFASLTQGAKEAGVPSRCVLVSNDDHFDPQLLPDAEVCVGHGNVGFAAGVRIGVEVADTDFVVIANPDTSITPRDAAAFISALTSQSAVLVPVLLNSSGNVAYASYEDWVFVGSRKIAESVCARFLLRKSSNDLPRWVRICGAFVGMSTSVARAYGPFDEAFFMYGEDRDLTRRLRRDAIPIRIARAVSVTHSGGGSGSGMNRELAVFRADSAMRIAYRRYGALGVRLKGLDLWLESVRKRGTARSHALEARRTVVDHWRLHPREAPRLDFAALS